MDHQPLLLPTTTTIFIRLSCILTITFLSLWANHESSKPYLQTTILLSNPSFSPSAHHFNLFFVSNGAADRLIYTSTNSIQHSLYPNHLLHSNLPILHATLLMSNHNLTTDVTTTPANLPNHFIIQLSPSLMSKPDVKASVAGAIHRGVALVWLLHGGGAAAPPAVLNEMVECLATLAGFPSGANGSKDEFCLERDEFQAVRRPASAGAGSLVGDELRQVI